MRGTMQALSRLRLHRTRLAPPLPRLRPVTLATSPSRSASHSRFRYAPLLCTDFVLGQCGPLSHPALALFFSLPTSPPLPSLVLTLPPSHAIALLGVLGGTLGASFWLSRNGQAHAESSPSISPRQASGLLGASTHSLTPPSHIPSGTSSEQLSADIQLDASSNIDSMRATFMKYASVVSAEGEWMMTVDDFIRSHVDSDRSGKSS